jgi:Na+/glutamate symporter
MDISSSSSQSSEDHSLDTLLTTSSETLQIFFPVTQMCLYIYLCVIPKVVVVVVVVIVVVVIVVVIVIKSIIRKKIPEDYKLMVIKGVGGGMERKKENLFLYFDVYP